MSRDQDRSHYKGQRPWYEIWFAVALDESRKRALWIRQTLFVPRQGEGRTTVWGAWFDADRTPPTRAGKRYARIDEAVFGGGETLIRGKNAWMSETAAEGAVDNLSWKLAWRGGRAIHNHDVPSWLPAPTHAHPIVYDAEGEAEVLVDGEPRTLKGHVSAMHLWGKRRLPTLQWFWTPWLGDASLEMQAVSFQDTFSLGFSTLRLDGPDKERSYHGRPATAAHPNCLVTSTVAGARKLVHARAWAEPSQMVGYAYRDTDGRDVMVAQSDIASAYYEVYTRTAPGAPWRITDKRRSSGGTAVEIHQHARLPYVDYIQWDETSSNRGTPPFVRPARATDEVDWPELREIVALGLTYGDHVRETGQKIDTKQPPVAFGKHVRTFAPGDDGVHVPDSAEILAALEEVEPGLAAALGERIARPPAVMDYEGELALVALGAIDAAALAHGTPQPFGIAAANDLTARMIQVLGEGLDGPAQLALWSRAKSFPRFLPLAPSVWAPPDGLRAMPELTIETRVNGDVRQRASTKLLVYDLLSIVGAAATQLGRPLERGDVILTGTPAGVGLRMSPLRRRVAAMVKDRFRKAELLVATYATSSALLRPGDVIEVDAGAAGRVRTRLIV
ncbi:MAG: fumarylacetoacetate hydrolase family protein [Deltaproteobacteria bacterium]|nr:fumarylacetoacetate hydrolase family protein [Deltaproteobacteria bacterium]